MDSMSVPIGVRSSTGVSVHQGPPSFGVLSTFQTDASKSCRAMIFSPDGKYFAWVNGRCLNLVSTEKWNLVAEIPCPRAFSITFSPRGTYLMSWEPFTVNKDNPQGSPNLHIFNTIDGQLVKSFVHKKQTNWEPQWSSDENLCVRIINTDLVFYMASNFEKIEKRINCYKIAAFSLSPSCNPYYVLCHMPGGSGQPSYARLFKYPNFDGQQALANKSFFQADKVEFYWNAKGTNALLLTMTEVDKTGGSYYGKQTLHYVSTNGETAMVGLSKEGPVYAVSWSPKNTEFCVIYGFVPAKATIFNLKCEPVFEMGTGPRNSIYYNPHGNMLLVAGFGNLRGQCEIWDVGNRKLIGKCDAPDSTLLQWCPDGVNFLTATTAPRLRIANGYKIWHYSGGLLYEKPWPQHEELYDVCWAPAPKGVYKEPSILEGKKIEGIITSQPQASKEAYRPPSARNRPPVAFRLHDDEGPTIPDSAAPSKNALKMRKKREARKQREKEEKEKNVEEKSPTTQSASNVEIQMTGDTEKDKRLKNIKKKLDAINKLKEQRDAGKVLEVNQLAKITGEEELLQELKQLQLQ